jgi:hypothetical protein
VAGLAIGKFWAVVLLGVYVTPVEVAAQGLTQVEGVGKVSLEGKTLEAARQKALELALADALSRSRLELTEVFTRTSRSLISGEQTAQYYHEFSQFVESVTRGEIVDYIVESDAVLPVYTEDKGRPQSYLVEVRVRATVQPSSGKSDPTYYLDVKLNRTSFRDGDSLELRVKPTKDSYITVLNLYSTDTLAVVFPNQLCPGNFVTAGSTLIIPPRGGSWSLRAGINPGRDKDVESFLIIATRDSIPFPLPIGNPDNSEQRGITQLITLGDAVKRIGRWLASIELGRRTVAQVVYHLYR